MSYGHALFLATGPRCGCGAPAFTADDTSGDPTCARCLLERTRAGSDPAARLEAHIAWIDRQARPRSRPRALLEAV